ncbi:hypothetical protein EUX98_g4717 [Antrodiella citrinella]|uniref:Uncharacterized protein n=1 Tax=Antrodiella citrinella TaxID=2447956 RepID=A0A4S4N191_9APHY|nr:hypothetical protein EUX98_g4717 [Antrodiella citrinella]
MGGLSGLILAWTNELTGYDNEKRSFVVACCNTFAYVFQAWLPIVIFPQVEQPRVFKGNVANACIDFALIGVAFLALYLQRRDNRRKAAAVSSSTVLVDDESEPRKSDDADVYEADVVSVASVQVK